MSNSDDQEKEVPQEEETPQEEEAPKDAPDEGDGLSPVEDSKKQVEALGGFPILFFIIGLAASLIVGWIIFPHLLYSRNKQPIDFNHVLHMEFVDEGCQSCHFFRGDGTFSGVPKLELCVDCHYEVQGNSPAEMKFMEEYVQKEKEIPWLIYAEQPDCVFFSHAAHVILAEMECKTCHGPIGTSTSSRVYEKNRITGYSRDIWGTKIENMLGFKKNTWDRMKMNDCAECHKEAAKKASSVQTQKEGCFVCHK